MFLNYRFRKNLIQRDWVTRQIGTYLTCMGRSWPQIGSQQFFLIFQMIQFQKTKINSTRSCSSITGFQNFLKRLSHENFLDASIPEKQFYIVFIAVNANLTPLDFVSGVYLVKSLSFLSFMKFVPQSRKSIRTTHDVFIVRNGSKLRKESLTQIEKSAEKCL